MPPLKRYIKIGTEGRLTCVFTPSNEVPTGGAVIAGDLIALTGYDSLSGAAASGGAARAVSNVLAGGGTSVTLGDGSTISFVGNTQGLHILSS